MLAVSSFTSCINNEREGEMESFSIGVHDDFSCGNLLDDIDFDDLFIGIGDGDVLPDLEMHSDMFADYSFSGGEESEVNLSIYAGKVEESGSSGSGLSLSPGEEIVSKRDESVKAINTVSADRGRKSSKSSQGKRKMKVDWTPELHRRFVQAVEQLGMDKAVPSRILELMGIDCLTRHNIASHLQKYRSHQKHLRAREAEAASWNQRRQIYGGAGGRGGHNKRDVSSWIAPIMGFPPPPPAHMQSFRPLHVWGHPSADQSSVQHMWPKHLAHSQSPPWASPGPYPPSLTAPPPPDSSYWHPHHLLVPNALTQGTPCFPPTLAPARFPTPQVPGVPLPRPVYKVDHMGGIPSVQPHPHAPLESHPSKESLDAAIGDVLSKPWLPLPLGLKPPSLDSVMVELQRQGIPEIPPT
ncbi:hypothetical protein GIB67_039221 [Kingdonia uniflora]|uniref:HTH myb-type domain-containing protein n=1 Tax=Kingdonia uniflora TaxID=39325 RepID=A0A7J7MM75_9MAGN|nr:hypothetical protein GIB67_039221 [Kingdonia uniflora]